MHRRASIRNGAGRLPCWEFRRGGPSPITGLRRAAEVLKKGQVSFRLNG